MFFDDLDNLLADLSDNFWKNRVKNSVSSVMELYNLRPEDSLVFRENIPPENLYIAAVEECVLANAKTHLAENYGVSIPLTVLRHQGKNVLFMGSTRSLQYMLKNKSPDCLVVHLPARLNPKIVSEAVISLRDLYRSLV
jgi:hypothetical protein